MAEELRVDDLTDLWRAGAVQLPQVAVQYSEMARALHKTGLSDEAAFRRSTGGYGPLYTAWTGLRNTIQNDVAARSYDNLVASGGALTQIAGAYATTDHLSAEQVGQYQQAVEDIEHSVNPDRSPPAYVPDAPRSTDPHPEEESSRYLGGY
jgi:hypothetical protein